MARKSTPSSGGAASVRERGLVQLLTAVTPEERRAIKTAAAAADMPLSHFLRAAAIEAARKAGFPAVGK